MPTKLNISNPPRIRQPKLAYRDGRFMESSNARTLRIGAEYLEPQARLEKAGVLNTIVFFGSARILPQDVARERLGSLDAENSAHPVPEEELRAARRAVEMSRYYEEARTLAHLITEWSLSLKRGNHFLVVCSGGGPGIMEAANRGASEAGGLSIGLNIKLPFEQKSNPYVSPSLNFIFKYFFMRKLWFAQPARALIVFPGGYGTMDELWEFVTLLQTRKMGHQAFILMYGSDYWKRLVNFDFLVESGTVGEEDLRLLRFVDSPEQALAIIKQKLRRNRAMRAALRHPFP
ncbi:MAG TPA: TIGR00730 family Rossman fold protein [Terriglobia bacterium]|nr:TIGR00730 family Rossman fold protein [Terriglobia bacterium]